jgi:hypothetical protein
MTPFPATTPWGVLAVGNLRDQHGAMAEYVRAHTRATDVVATNDIGFVGLLADRAVLDTVGLVSPDVVAHYARGGNTLDYLLQQRPALVVVYPGWYPGLATHPAFERVHAAPLRLNVITGGRELVAFRLRDPR